MKGKGCFYVKQHLVKDEPTAKRDRHKTRASDVSGVLSVPNIDCLQRNTE